MIIDYSKLLIIKKLDNKTFKYKKLKKEQNNYNNLSENRETGNLFNSKNQIINSSNKYIYKYFDHNQITNLLDIDQYNNINLYDIFISIGGDEHFKYMIHKLNFIEKKYVNICLNPCQSECKLTNLKFKDIKFIIDKIINKKFTIKYLDLIKVTIDKNTELYGLDTIYIGSSIPYKISNYNIKFNNIQEKQKSSGIIISTNMGSTGWYKSNSSEYFEENNKSKFLIRELYKSKFHNNKITRGTLNYNNNLEISFNKETENIINIDSYKTLTISNNQIIKVFLSKNKIKMINII